MDDLWWIYLLRPFIGIAYLALLFFGAKFIAMGIYRVFPSGKVKDYLFLGWKGRRPGRSAKPEQSVLDNPSLLSRERPEDSTRL